jgi:pilus assembly protein CpaB
MSMKTWAPLAVAVGLGLVAAVAARKYMAQANGPRHEVHTQRIVVASHDVAPGTALTQGDLTLQSIPMDASATGTFAQVSDVVGRVTLASLGKEKAVIAAMLAPTGTNSGLQSLIPEGMRAMTLEVNEFSGVAGLLTPGCRVDVLATLRPDQKDGVTTRVIAQNLQVKAVGQSLSAQPEAKSDDKNNKERKEQTLLPRSVTLLATPKQAEMIQLACDSGRPWLVLRGGKDDAPIATPGVTLAELRGKPADADKAQGHEKSVPVVQVQMPSTRPTMREVDAQPEPKVRRTVQLIRGANESTVIFEMPAKMAVSSVAE